MQTQVAIDDDVNDDDIDDDGNDYNDDDNEQSGQHQDACANWSDIRVASAKGCFKHPMIYNPSSHDGHDDDYKDENYNDYDDDDKNYLRKLKVASSIS